MVFSFNADDENTRYLQSLPRHGYFGKTYVINKALREYIKRNVFNNL